MLIKWHGFVQDSFVYYRLFISGLVLIVFVQLLLRYVCSIYCSVLRYFSRLCILVYVILSIKSLLSFCGIPLLWFESLVKLWSCVGRLS